MVLEVEKVVCSKADIDVELMTIFYHTVDLQTLGYQDLQKTIVRMCDVGRREGIVLVPLLRGVYTFTTQRRA